MTHTADLDVPGHRPFLMPSGGCRLPQFSSCHGMNVARCWESAHVELTAASLNLVGATVRMKSPPLVVTHPALAAEACGWDPATVSAGSNKKVRWKCRQGHEWMAQISNRSNGTGCPVCAGRRVMPGFNDLCTTHPKLAAEIVDIDSATVSAGSNKRFLWKCDAGHRWGSFRMRKGSR